MKDEFKIELETMPRTTSQEKGVYIRNGRPYFYEKSKVEAARYAFTYALKKYAPEFPTIAPVKLFVWFTFDVKDKKKWGKYKTSKPDTDNYLKLFKDCMTDVGFWLDDAQVVDERCIKTYAEQASIYVRWRELEERP